MSDYNLMEAKVRKARKFYRCQAVEFSLHDWCSKEIRPGSLYGLGKIVWTDFRNDGKIWSMKLCPDCFRYFCEAELGWNCGIIPSLWRERMNAEIVRLRLEPIIERKFTSIAPSQSTA